MLFAIEAKFVVVGKNKVISVRKFGGMGHHLAKVKISLYLMLSGEKELYLWHQPERSEKMSKRHGWTTSNNA